MLHSDSSLFSGHTNMDHCLALGDTGPGVRALVGREAQGRGEGKSGVLTPALSPAHCPFGPVLLPAWASDISATK